MLVVLMAAAVAFAVWVTVIDPEMEPKIDLSAGATASCFRDADGLEVSEEGTRELQPALGAGRVLLLAARSQRAAVFFFGSESDARRAEREMRQVVSQGAEEQGFSAAELDRLPDRRVLRRGSHLLVYSGPDHAPSRATVERFGECIYAIEVPRYESFNVLDVRTIDRPYAAKREAS